MHVNNYCIYEYIILDCNQIVIVNFAFNLSYFSKSESFSRYPIQVNAP